jgi:hypothetical protein
LLALLLLGLAMPLARGCAGDPSAPALSAPEAKAPMRGKL